MVLLIMSSCLPRFRQVQKKTDQINRVALENLTGINVVHAFGAEDYQNRKFDGPSRREMMNLQLKNQRLFALLHDARLRHERWRSPSTGLARRWLSRSR